MSYALFAQRKVVLDGELNGIQLQQTQRSNEQQALATETLSLQQQLTSMNAAQSGELAELYALLSHSDEDGLDVDAAIKSIGDTNGDGKVNEDDVSKSIKDDGLLDKKKTRDDINAAIKAKEQAFQSELDGINRDIYQVSVKENAVEMEVKRLDTMVTATQKQLDATEQAEGQGIDKATPKYKGVG